MFGPFDTTQWNPDTQSTLTVSITPKIVIIMKDLVPKFFQSLLPRFLQVLLRNVARNFCTSLNCLN